MTLSVDFDAKEVPPLTLRPDDKVLAAYLLQRDVVPVDTFAAALKDAVDRGRGLGESLVSVGALSSSSLAVHRERAAQGGRVFDAGHPQDTDTWFDLPRRGPSAPTRDTGSTDVKVVWASEVFGSSPNGGSVAIGADDDRPPPNYSSRFEALDSAVESPRYVLKDEIGRGGMGRILRALDRRIGRQVAVKVLHGGHAVEESSVRRFWTEVQATGQLEHPSIIPVHDVGRLPTGEHFYVMKKLSGRSLADILDALLVDDPEVGEFDRARLLTIFQQVAYAVAFAHAHGVIHRDIKPANIMVGRYGEAILIDWGLAKVQGHAEDVDPSTADRPVERIGQFSAAETAAGTITGTPQYMSPEATLGKPDVVGPKTDVYGLGAVLYEILTYHPAFADEGFVPTVMKVRKGTFVPPQSRRPEVDVPAELSRLCLRAMASTPEQRPSAKSLADEIGRILQGARERERRGREASARLEEGREATQRWKQLKRDLNALESEVKVRSKSTPAHAALKDKTALWQVEDRVGDLKVLAVEAFEEGEAAFLRALGEVPDHRDARDALASLYFARFVEAEQAREQEGQRYYRRLVARYDDGAWASLLDGDGTLQVRADVPDLEVTLARYQQTEARVLKAPDPQPLGRTPIDAIKIQQGSYQLMFRRPDGPTLVRPVVIGRAEAVEVHLRYHGHPKWGRALCWCLPGLRYWGATPSRTALSTGTLSMFRSLPSPAFP